MSPHEATWPSFASDASLTLDVAAFLYHEAQLLDRRWFGEWLALFSDDACYWVPIGDADDPSRAVSIVYDDRRRLGERVERLLRGVAPSQLPPSRTSHLVGNVVVEEAAGDDVHVSSRAVVTEYRLGAQQVYAGAVSHALRRQPSGWQIRRKVVRLVNSEAALGNLSLLL